jgi:hypothetical protein
LLLEEWTSDLNSELTSNSNTTLLCFHIPRTPLISLHAIFIVFPRLKKRLKRRRHENIEAIQAAETMELTGIPKEHAPAAFRTCRNAGNSVLTGEGTTLRGTGSISCEVEFCIFYRLCLKTLQTKDVNVVSSSLHFTCVCKG